MEIPMMQCLLVWNCNLWTWKKKYFILPKIIVLSRNSLYIVFSLYVHKWKNLQYCNETKKIPLKVSTVGTKCYHFFSPNENCQSMLFPSIKILQFGVVFNNLSVYLSLEIKPMFWTDFFFLTDLFSFMWPSFCVLDVLYSHWSYWTCFSFCYFPFIIYFFTLFCLLSK